MSQSFQALVADQTGDGVLVQKKTLGLDNLMPGEVTIRVSYSSVNYKDGLASISTGRVVRSYPLVLGIELAGEVVQSEDTRFLPGDQVIVAGYELGVSHFGGYSEVARVPADWVIPLPRGMTAQEAMTIGVAGFTAGLSLYRLEQNGLKPGDAPIVVTGATGGVGCIAVALLSNCGYRVSASTGKAHARDFLHDIGAESILSRSETSADSPKALESARWAAAIDPVGGMTLSYLLRTVEYGGSVALSGLTGGATFQSTVFPFIIRGINLLGIESGYCSNEVRREIWSRFEGPWKLSTQQLERIRTEISFDDIPRALDEILGGQVMGRIVVRM